MAVKDVIANLMVTDVRQSAAFYSALPGLTLTGCVDRERRFHPRLTDQGALIWAVFSLGDREVLMLHERADLVRDLPFLDGKTPGEGSFTLYFVIDDLDALHERLCPRVRTVHALTATHYRMREWHVADPDGYVVCLAQEAAG